MKFFTSEKKSLIRLLNHGDYILQRGEMHNIQGSSVGSPQVSFLMCTLEIPQKNCSTSSLLLTLFTFTFEPFLKL